MNLAEFQRFTAGLAHEIRNPLNTAQIQLHLLDRNLKKAAAISPSLHLDQSLRNVRNIQQEVTRLNLLLDDLFLYVRPYEFQLEEEALREILNEAIGEALKKHAKEVNIIREYEDASPVVLTDRSKMRQAILNLLLNAIEAIPEAGNVRVGYTCHAGTASIHIQDDGPGILEDDLPYIFDVFYSTKEMGTGLGLPVARRIIEELGGALSVSTQPMAGTTFRVALPVEPGTKSGPKSSESSPLSAEKERASNVALEEAGNVLC